MPMTNTLDPALAVLKACRPPCPFCGNSQLTVKINHDVSHGHFQAQVECEMCGGCGPATAWYPSREAAVRWLGDADNDYDWNTRPSPPAPKIEGGVAVEQCDRDAFLRFAGAHINEDRLTGEWIGAFMELLAGHRTASRALGSEGGAREIFESEPHLSDCSSHRSVIDGACSCGQPIRAIQRALSLSPPIPKVATEAAKEQAIVDYLERHKLDCPRDRPMTARGILAALDAAPIPEAEREGKCACGECLECDARGYAAASRQSAQGDVAEIVERLREAYAASLGSHQDRAFFIEAADLLTRLSKDRGYGEGIEDAAKLVEGSYLAVGQGLSAKETEAGNLRVLQLAQAIRALSGQNGGK